MKKIDDILCKFETMLAGVVVSTMVVCIFLQVFFRYVMKTGLPWSEEIARYAMIYLIFLGVSIGTRQGAHIGIDAFVNLLPEAVKKAFSIIVGAISLAILASLFVLSLQLTMRIFATGQLSPAMKIPMFIPNIALPLGFGLGAVRQVQVLARNILRFRESGTRGEGGA